MNGGYPAAPQKEGLLKGGCSIHHRHPQTVLHQCLSGKVDQILRLASSKWQTSLSHGKRRHFGNSSQRILGSLHQVFKPRAINLSNSCEMFAIIRGFEKVKAPEWDIMKVLASLDGPPFSPLQKASDKDLTLKTVFLLALTAAKRIRELHYLSLSPSLFLEFFQEFMTKTQNPLVPDQKSERFLVPSFKDSVGDDMEETLVSSWSRS